MYLDTQGIILKQVKMLDGKRILSIFTPDLGKISVSSSVNERTKSKSALPLRPFTLGKYTLYKKSGFYYLNRAETYKSFFPIGEDVNKYLNASFALEYTEKLLPCDTPAASIFDLLCDFLDLMQQRNREQGTLLLAYIIKTFRAAGVMPILDSCADCGTVDFKNGISFSVDSGGIVCKNCAEINHMSGDSLILAVDFGIVKIFSYILNNSLYALKKLAIEDESFDVINTIVRMYIERHLGICGLKSEGLL